jgi:hypothetical protein
VRLRLLSTVLLVSIAGTALGDPQVDAAIDSLQNDSSLKVRAQAAILLGQRRAREAVGPLSHAARRDSSEAVRLAAVFALGKIGDLQGLPAVEFALKDDDENVRAAAQAAMKELVGSCAPGSGGASVTIDEARGEGSPSLRAEFRDALERQLRKQCFNVMTRGAGHVLRPSIEKVDPREEGGKTVVTVRAAVVAVDGKGTMTAMLHASGTGKIGAARTPALEKRCASAAAEAAATKLTDGLKESLGNGR